MAKMQKETAKRAKNSLGEIIDTTITAKNYVNVNAKGKPARPEGMSDTEWCKVIINIRVPKMLAALESVARIATLPGFADLPKANARIINDMDARVENIHNAFENPSPDIRVKKVRESYVS